MLILLDIFTTYLCMALDHLLQVHFMLRFMSKNPFLQEVSGQTDRRTTVRGRGGEINNNLGLSGRQWRLSVFLHLPRDGWMER